MGLSAWCVALAALLTGRGLAGMSRMSLYPLYFSGAVMGWGLGNLYVARTRSALRAVKRILLPLYLLTPPGVLFLLWATADDLYQKMIPLAPVYASGVFAIFFLVPVSFARQRRWEVKSGDRELDDR